MGCQRRAQGECCREESWLRERWIYLLREGLSGRGETASCLPR